MLMHAYTECVKILSETELIRTLTTVYSLLLLFPPVESQSDPEQKTLHYACEFPLNHYTTVE